MSFTFTALFRVPYAWLSIFLLITGSVQAQEPIPFTKHAKINNMFTGTKVGFELPVYAGAMLTSDYEYEEAGTKSPQYFGVSPKITLKNGWGRGLGLGLGLDYATHKYWRANILLDLDLLFAYSVPMNEKGTRASFSMFTKFEFTKILASVDSKAIQEYYLAVNVFKIQIAKIAGEWGVSFGLMRDKYPPHFADKGMYYKLSYFIF